MGVEGKEVSLLSHEPDISQTCIRPEYPVVTLKSNTFDDYGHEYKRLGVMVVSAIGNHGVRCKTGPRALMSR
jgi:hypothetical protein